MIRLHSLKPVLVPLFSVCLALAGCFSLKVERRPDIVTPVVSTNGVEYYVFDGGYRVQLWSFCCDNVVQGFYAAYSNGIVYVSFNNANFQVSGMSTNITSSVTTAVVESIGSVVPLLAADTNEVQTAESPEL